MPYEALVAREAKGRGTDPGARSPMAARRGYLPWRAAVGRKYPSQKIAIVKRITSKSSDLDQVCTRLPI